MKYKTFFSFVRNAIKPLKDSFKQFKSGRVHIQGIEEPNAISNNRDVTLTITWKKQLLLAASAKLLTGLPHLENSK